ncbi:MULTISPECIES: hypothetical protein [unclassified Frigoribacterium]|uniref:hypothetical protein n=1 Tax=unclassified Frigoribacterium TaxID=2627005 RepID=UPI0006FB7A89|nr:MULTISPECIES: hypothetical protein [unclassified Frigoribacterium]KQO80419.1 hypothetical protein ASF17_14040 [Frigoribacterium sp. Leaf263]KQR65766.1 hypothetical protein ASF89_00770 [Frigoribacterium sp. Leaf172]
MNQYTMTVDGNLYLLAEDEDPERIQRDITAARTKADFVTARLSGNGSLAVLVTGKVPKKIRFDISRVDPSSDV